MKLDSENVCTDGLQILQLRELRAVGTPGCRRRHLVSAARKRHVGFFCFALLVPIHLALSFIPFPLIFSFSSHLFSSLLISSCLFLSHLVSSRLFSVFCSPLFDTCLLLTLTMNQRWTLMKTTTTCPYPSCLGKETSLPPPLQALGPSLRLLNTLDLWVSSSTPSLGSLTMNLPTTRSS
jgi:hypothetical protein